MARLSRSTAGRRVAARARRLSDDLLFLEEDCFADIGKTLLQGSPKAARLVEDAFSTGGTVDSLAGNASLRQQLGQIHRDYTTATLDASRTLLQDTADMVIASIGEELAECEKTLGKRYVGLARSATEWAESLNTDMVDEAIALHAMAVPAAQVIFQQDVQRQMLLAAQYDTEPEHVLARLFSVGPVSRPGIGGRGVWHRTGSFLNESTRRVSIQLGNSLRQSAMLAFNEYGETRE